MESRTFASSHFRAARVFGLSRLRLVGLPRSIAGNLHSTAGNSLFMIWDAHNHA